jgi:hypothetical protein
VAGGTAEVTVGQLRGWITEEQPGLPEQVQNLLIACYAVQTDKAWQRAGRPAEPPRLDRIADDFVLRSQELPTPEEFEIASKRADGIFRIKPQPVRTSRSVHVLADAIRRNARGRLDAARSLATQLDEHAATLGLDDTAERQVTSRQLTALLDRLAAATDDTQAVRVLAAAALAKENAFYFAHLDSAERLAPALRDVTWHVLDDLAATNGDVEADLIITPLRQAARRDEHEQALAGPLRKAAGDAITLIRERARRPDPATPAPPAVVPPAVLPVVLPRPSPGQPIVGPEPTPAPSPPPPGNRMRAKEVAAYVMKIINEADEHPDAEFEISWRIVES